MIPAALPRAIHTQGAIPHGNTHGTTLDNTDVETQSGDADESNAPRSARPYGLSGEAVALFAENPQWGGYKRIRQAKGLVVIRSSDGR